MFTVCRHFYKCSANINSFYFHDKQNVGSIIISSLQMKSEAQRDEITFPRSHNQ